MLVKGYTDIVDNIRLLSNRIDALECVNDPEYSNELIKYESMKTALEWAISNKRCII